MSNTKSFIEFISESTESSNSLTKEDIVETWDKVFSDSFISVRGGSLGDGLYCKGFLAKDKSELAQGYFENDTLSYSFSINDNVYEETTTSLTINPTESYMAYGTVKTRKKKIKDIDVKKLEKRFKEIKEFIKDNKSDIPESLSKFYDIDKKLK